MGSLLSILLGTGLAVAVVLAFWLLVDFVDELRRQAHTSRDR